MYSPNIKQFFQFSKNYLNANQSYKNLILSILMVECSNRDENMHSKFYWQIGPFNNLEEYFVKTFIYYIGTLNSKCSQSIFTCYPQILWLLYFKIIPSKR